MRAPFPRKTPTKLQSSAIDSWKKDWNRTGRGLDTAGLHSTLNRWWMISDSIFYSNFAMWEIVDCLSTGMRAWEWDIKHEDDVVGSALCSLSWLAAVKNEEEIKICFSFMPVFLPIVSDCCGSWRRDRGSNVLQPLCDPVNDLSQDSTSNDYPDQVQGCNCHRHCCCCDGSHWFDENLCHCQYGFQCFSKFRIQRQIQQTRLWTPGCFGVAKIRSGER